MTHKNNLRLGLLALCSALVWPVAARAKPLFAQTDVFVAGQDGVVEYRIPVLVTSNRGTLLALCDARVKKIGDPPNYVRAVLKRSTDNGRTWGPLQTVVDPGEGNGAVADSCGLVDRQTGTIWVFSDYCPEGVGGGNAARGLTGATVSYKAVKSDDDGITWSQPIDLTPMVKKPAWRAGSFGPGKGIQMRNGRLVAPRYHVDSTGRDEDATSFVNYSDDHGRTWKIGGDAKTPGKTNECQVVETADGSLLLNMREVKGNHRKIARSRDGGVTWSEVTEDATLVEPRCQGSVESYADASREGGNRVLFSNPASLKRENLTVRLSYDGGLTWPVAKSLHPGPSAYSCLTVLSDRTAGCLYECGEKGPYEKIVFARFDSEWLTDASSPTAVR